ncbi:MAG: TapY2 family type IVa secretion system protein [Colwellia sp.]|nr:TapY2 family type IVa secretion system protein [Colwellia sp.]MCW8863960.1 TapY2 family type IVa secretion system protein [Colwellia sp.]MCW9080101.1 TapY2 family type IVa secretion system protein [Colwellia sp.]
MKTKFKSFRKVNLFSPLILTVCCLTLITHVEAHANASVSSKSKAKKVEIVDIEMKCHVELIGGGETIQFTNTPYKSLKKLTHILLKKKVKLEEGEPPRAIYKVKECVPLNEKFKGARAKQLFLNIPY